MTEAAEDDVVGQGRRLIAEAAARGLPLRLIGGVAFWLRASERARGAFARTYPDLDLVAHRHRSRVLRALLEELGYQPERTFNAMHGARRLLYRSPQGYQVDIFLDVFEMCHKIDLGRRLEVEPETVPAAELALTKLQIQELNRKDLTDLLMLLTDHETDGQDGPGRLNSVEVARCCASDWGLYTTVTDNLRELASRAQGLAPDPGLARLAVDRVGRMLAAIEAAPKSPAWRVRAAVGRRMRWYMLPEEVVR